MADGNYFNPIIKKVTVIVFYINSTRKIPPFKVEYELSEIVETEFSASKK